MLETKFDGKHIPYIGVSPANDRSTKEKNEWFEIVFRMIGQSSNPNVKTHAFGMTSLPVLERYPFTSADSTSWIMTGANGGIMTPNGTVVISEKQKDNHNITIIPLEQYTARTVIKLIKKYSKMNYDVIVLDTLKESYDSRDKESWKSLMTDCVDFYDCIKHTDTCMVITYQLVKNKSRYLSNADIGISKGILDVFSVNIFFRRPLKTELEGEKDALYCYKHDGTNSTISFKLRKDKHYMIGFISKNRFGQSDIQIVSEADFSINKYQDEGYCIVPQDF